MTETGVELRAESSNVDGRHLTGPFRLSGS